MTRIALGALAVCLLSGCPSFTNLKTARALDQGEFQVTVAAELGSVSVPTTADTTGAVVFYPQFEVAGRWGVANGPDLGFKVYPVGAEFDATIQLIRGDFDLALSPGIGIFGIGFNASSDGSSQSEAYVSVPVHLDLLAGVHFGAGHEFVIGPGLYTFFTLAGASSGGSSESATSVTAMAGGTVGVSFKFGHSFRIMPEFDIYFPFAGEVNSTSSTTSSFGVSGAFVYTIAVGFSFGDDGFGPPPNSKAARPPAN